MASNLYRTHSIPESLLRVTRRNFLKSSAGFSLGAIALNQLLHGGASSPGEARGHHFAARAKRVIYLTQSGGPSQIELFDHKPNLKKWEGTKIPDSVRQGQRLTLMTAGSETLVMAASRSAWLHKPSMAGCLALILVIFQCVRSRILVMVPLVVPISLMICESFNSG